MLMHKSVFIVAIAFTYTLLIAYFFVCCFSQTVHAEEHFQQEQKDRGKLYVYGLWGLANRLRSWNVAWDVAGAMNRDLVLVIEDEFGPMYNAHPDDLWKFPNVPVIKASALPSADKMEKVMYNAACSITFSWGTKVENAVDLRTLNETTTKKDMLLECCGMDLVGESGLRLTNAFYHAIQPSDKVMREIDPLLSKIKSHNVVGVHIRQGTIADYFNAEFFGHWDNKDQTPPTQCCFRDQKRNLSSCPSSASLLEDFIVAMKRETNADFFFVCSDRPGCFLMLEQEFPRRLLYNRIKVEHDLDTMTAFCDWFCLAHCKKMLLSRASSFSQEASKLYNPEYVLV